jgi:predicted ATPase
VFQELPVTGVAHDPRAEVRLDPDAWPAAIPAVADLLAHGLQLGPLTVLVGENGSGKSTLVEAIAQAYGLSPEGGSTGARVSTRQSESELHRALRLQRGVGATKWGFFLRAETMHGYYSYLEENPGRSPEPVFHELSHGESFLGVLEHRFEDPGFYVLDEPESALSFTGCLALVGLLHRMARDGRRQALVATHSPIVAATPGATIIEVGEHGLREVEWQDLELVRNWTDFLADPSIFLRHVLE